MLSRSSYTGDGPTWNRMSDILLKSLRWEEGGGGFVYFGGGFAKRGVRTNPPNPPWLRACRGFTYSTLNSQHPPEEISPDEQKAGSGRGHHRHDLAIYAKAQ